MREYEIITPDGKKMVVEGPEDATDEDLISFAQAELAKAGSEYVGRDTVVNRPVAAPTIAPTIEDVTPERRPGSNSDFRTLINQGALFGLSDELAGIGTAVGDALSGRFGDIAGSYREGRDAERQAVEDALARSPLGGNLALLAGGFLGGRPTAALDAIPDALRATSAIREGAKVGAVGGALGGFGTGTDTETSLTGGVLGGVFGGALGGTLPVLAAVGGNVVSGANRFLGRNRDDLARQIVGDALAADANTGASAGAMIDNAQRLGVPYMLGDTGENARALTASVARQPGASRTIVRDALRTRQEGQGDRIRGYLERDLGRLSSTAEDAAAARAAATARAQSAVVDASGDVERSVGGVAPLVDRAASGSAARETFETARDVAKARTREAYNAPELINPQPIDIPGSFFSEEFRNAANRYYGDGGGEIPATLRQIIDDAAAEGATTRTLTNIDRRLADFAGQARMSGANGDASFAETVRRDLDAFAQRAAPPEYRAALANAKSMRAEQGRLFETRDVPRAMARDRYGNPLVGDTELATRLFRGGAPGGDTADSLIAAVGADRAEEMARSELRRVLDDAGDLGPQSLARLNQRYGEALARFPALQRDLALVSERAGALATAQEGARAAERAVPAIERGAQAVRRSPDEIARDVAALSESEREAYAQGMRNSLADVISRRVDDADKVRALTGTPQRRDALASVYDGENLDRFNATLGMEGDANETFGLVFKGSNTARFQADDARIADPGLADTAFDVGLRGITNGPTGVMVELLNRFRDAREFGKGEAGDRVRQTIASLLVETDAASLREIVEAANRAAQARVNATGRQLTRSVDLSGAASRGIVTAAGNTGGK